MVLWMVKKTTNGIPLNTWSTVQYHSITVQYHSASLRMSTVNVLVSMVNWMVKHKRTVYHWAFEVPFNIYPVSMVFWMIINERTVYHWEPKIQFSTIANVSGVYRVLMIFLIIKYLIKIGQRYTIQIPFNTIQYRSVPFGTVQYHWYIKDTFFNGTLNGKK